MPKCAYNFVLYFPLENIAQEKVICVHYNKLLVYHKSHVL